MQKELSDMKAMIQGGMMTTAAATAAAEAKRIESECSRQNGMKKEMAEMCVHAAALNPHCPLISGCLKTGVIAGIR